MERSVGRCYAFNTGSRNGVKIMEMRHAQRDSTPQHLDP